MHIRSNLKIIFHEPIGVTRESSKNHLHCTTDYLHTPFMQNYIALRDKLLRTKDSDLSPQNFLCPSNYLHIVSWEPKAQDGKKVKILPNFSNPCI